MYAKPEIVRLPSVTDKCTCSGGMGPIVIGPGTEVAQ
jgi:hypothetical protein